LPQTSGETTTIVASGSPAVTAKAPDVRDIRGETSQTIEASAPSRTVGGMRLAVVAGVRGRSVSGKAAPRGTDPRQAAGLNGPRTTGSVTGSIAPGNATAPATIADATTAAVQASAAGNEASDPVVAKRIAALAKRTEPAGRTSDPVYGRSRTTGSGRIGRSTHLCPTR